MTLVNKLMKAPQVAATMQELSKEMMRVCNIPLGILQEAASSLFPTEIVSIGFALLTKTLQYEGGRVLISGFKI